MLICLSYKTFYIFAVHFNMLISNNSQASYILHTHSNPNARPPSASICSTVAAFVLPSMSTHTTIAPSRPYCSASSRPMPCPVPVHSTIAPRTGRSAGGTQRRQTATPTALSQRSASTTISASRCSESSSQSGLLGEAVALSVTADAGVVAELCGKSINIFLNTKIAYFVFTICFHASACVLNAFAIRVLFEL